MNISRFLGVRWSLHHGVGIHIADDAVRLVIARTSSQPNQALAIGRYSLQRGNVVGGHIRQPGVVASAVDSLLVSAGVQGPEPLAFAVDVPIYAVGGEPSVSLVMAPVVSHGRSIGTAAASSQIVRGVAAALRRIQRTCVIEPVALGVVRLGQQLYGSGNEVSFEERSEWATTKVMIDADHSIEAVVGRAERRREQGLWVGDVEADQRLDVETETGLGALVQNHVDDDPQRYIPALGAAMFTHSPIQCDLTNGLVASDALEPRRWTVERINPPWWTEPFEDPAAYFSTTTNGSTSDNA